MDRPDGTVLRALLLKPFIRQKMGFMMSKVNRSDLLHLRELMEAGKVLPMIDKVYNRLNKVPAAIGYLEGGRARGKWLSFCLDDSRDLPAKATR